MIDGEWSTANIYADINAVCVFLITSLITFLINLIEVHCLSFTRRAIRIMQNRFFKTSMGVLAVVVFKASKKKHLLITVFKMKLCGGFCGRNATKCDVIIRLITPSFFA